MTREGQLSAQVQMLGTVLDVDQQYRGTVLPGCAIRGTVPQQDKYGVQFWPPDLKVPCSTWEERTRIATGLQIIFSDESYGIGHACFVEKIPGGNEHCLQIR